MSICIHNEEASKTVKSIKDEILFKQFKHSTLIYETTHSLCKEKKVYYKYYICLNQNIPTQL